MKIHFSFFFRQMVRVIKPGRVMMVHCAQIPNMKRAGGDGGMIDFRGLLIRIAKRAGFVFEYDWIVRKNPQAQAIRSKSRELQFAGLESDRAKSRGAMPDYLLKFRVPGENKVPIRDFAPQLDDDGDATGEDVRVHDTQVSRNDWIQWAESSWADIRETDTLNYKEGRSEEDTRHICPLQIPVVDRLVRLYSNPGEIVLSPFTGIGTEAYCSLKVGRRFYGCEIKKEYYDTALKNCERALRKSETQAPLFEMSEA